MQPYTLPKIKLPEYIEPETALIETPIYEGRRPNRCSLDSLPLELLREIVKQVAPRSVFDTQRTLARLVMVNKQLRYLLLEDARKTMRVNSQEKIGQAVDSLPKDVFASVETLIVTKEEDQSHQTPQRDPDSALVDLGSSEFADWCKEVPMLRSLYLRDLDEWIVDDVGLSHLSRAFPLDVPALSGLSLLAVKDAAIMANDMKRPQLYCEHLSLCGVIQWEPGSQNVTQPESLLCSDPTRFPRLRTLRLGPLYGTEGINYAPPRLLDLPRTLVQQLGALQVDLNAIADHIEDLAVPACYFNADTPTLFRLSWTFVQNPARIREMERFRYVRLDEPFFDTSERFCSMLLSSSELRAFFYSESQLSIYKEDTAPDRRLRKFLDDLEKKGVDVIACETDDDDDLILPEFLDYLKKRKEIGRA